MLRSMVTRFTKWLGGEKPSLHMWWVGSEFFIEYSRNKKIIRRYKCRFKKPS